MFEPQALKLLGLIFSVFCLTGASASPDARRNCPSVVDENDYENHGGQLVEARSADLTSFPKGFEPLTECQGLLAMTGIVQPDGAVLLEGIDRDSVRCGGDGPVLAGKSLWRTTLISVRFRSARYKPPQVANGPVCVRIRRSWSPNAPHELAG